jgi:hypothetical protein
MTDRQSIKTGPIEVKIRGFFRSSWRKRVMTLARNEITLAFPGRDGIPGRVAQSFTLSSLDVSVGADPMELVVQPNTGTTPLYLRCRGEAEAQSWLHGLKRAGMADPGKPTDTTAQRSLSARISSVRAGTAAVAMASQHSVGSLVEESPDDALVSYDRDEDKADITVLDGGEKVKCSIYDVNDTATDQTIAADESSWPLASMMVNGGITFGETQNLGMFAPSKPQAALSPKYVNGGVTAGGYSLNMGVFKLPEDNALLKERRVTMGSAQALLLLFRDARVMKERNQLAEAEHLMQQHLSLVQMVFGPQSDKAVRSMQLLADIVASRGHHADAQQLLEEASAIERQLVK